MKKHNDICADVLASAFLLLVGVVFLVVAWKLGGCLARADEMPPCTRERFNPDCAPCCADAGAWQPFEGAITGWCRCDSAAYLRAHPCLVATSPECDHGGSAR